MAAPWSTVSANIARSRTWLPMAVQGRGVGFDDVLKMPNGMLARLKSESSGISMNDISIILQRSFLYDQLADWRYQILCLCDAEGKMGMRRAAHQASCGLFLMLRCCCSSAACSRITSAASVAPFSLLAIVSWQGCRA
ncbi:hypothetical protein ABW21_db0204707 [Orbilia brochopaga]|nr:hypothetical protein ABW21_db0204707 [Drechslerella brochopaga]